MEMTGGSVMNTANSKVQNSCRETPANNRKYNTYILIIFSLSSLIDIQSNNWLQFVTPGGCGY